MSLHTAILIWLTLSCVASPFVGFLLAGGSVERRPHVDLESKENTSSLKEVDLLANRRF
jgi:hypothetical protein